MGSAIQDLYVFRTENKDNKFNIHLNRHRYPIGNLFGCTIYVDNFMRYDDNRIIIGDIDYELIHNNKIIFNDDLSKLEFGYDQKIKPNSKVEILNIIDTDMFLF